MQQSRSTFRVRYFLALCLFALSGIAFLDRTNISIAGPQISAEFALGNERLGWVFSAFLIGYAATQIPAGWLASRFGPRRVLAMGTVWWSVATVSAALLPPSMRGAVLWLIVLRLVLGAGEAVIYPAANQFVARWIPVRERGLINGLIFAGVGAGSGLTPPLLNWIITHHGWRSAFWFSAAVGLLIGAIWWLSATDTPEEHPRVSSAELREIHQAPLMNPRQPGALVPEDDRVAPLSPREAGARPPIEWKAMLARRDLPALMVSYFSFGYISWIYFSWFFLYMSQVRGFDLKSSARYSMLPFLSMTLCCLLGGALSDRLSARFGLRVGRCLIAGGALCLTAALLLAGSQAHDPVVAACVLAAGAGALYLSQSSFWSVSIDIAERSSGVFSSIVNIGGQVGGAVTASLTPWIAHRFGWTTSFAVAACMAVAGALCWILVDPERSVYQRS